MLDLSTEGKQDASEVSSWSINNTMPLEMPGKVVFGALRGSKGDGERRTFCSRMPNSVWGENANQCHHPPRANT